MPSVFFPVLRSKKGRKTMIRLIAAAGFALAVATSAQAMTPAPLFQPDGMITQTRMGCGMGRVMVGAVVCSLSLLIRWAQRAGWESSSFIGLTWLTSNSG
jgi:hypothetical protein